MSESSSAAATAAPAEVKDTTGSLCPATVAELKEDYPGLKLADICSVPGCGLAVARHARHTATTGSFSSSSSSWTNNLLKFVSGNRLPKWKNSSVCRPFLDQLSLLLPSSGLPEDKWNQVFPYIVEDLSAAKWITENIINKGLDWATSKQVFTAHFQSSDYSVALEREYDDCKQGRNESVQHYADRFSDLCNQLGIEDDSKEAIRHFINHLNEAMLRDYHKATAVLRIKDKDYKIASLREAITVCIELDYAHRNTTAYSSAGSGSHHATSGSGSGKDSNVKRCKFHPDSKSHSTAECQTGSFASHAGSPNEAKQEQKSNKNPTCYSCGQTGHYANDP
jgi:hypothetical protein